MKYNVGDRVRCVSTDLNAPVGIVGTVIEIKHQVFLSNAGISQFDYIVKWDEGQNEKVDFYFPDGAPEEAEGLELIEES